jgi:hypothetical protein
VGDPYREAAEPGAKGQRDELTSVDVSGVRGADGARGHDGANGTRGGDGQLGGDAGPAGAGQDGGTIRLRLAFGDGLYSLRGEAAHAGAAPTEVDRAGAIGDAGAIHLRASGGRGGRGGDGGTGGTGGTGTDGADATRFSSGDDGGPGGDGGGGGDATSGGPGGAGGTIVVRVADADTAALMLLAPVVRGGPGGAPGENGSGGAGGEGGKGGSSYSWTETDTRTGSDGRRESVTTRHTNHGGSRGRRGRDGADGAARVSVGADGADGRVAIEVERDGVITTYAERYELRLRGFTHADASGDGVYEPGDRVVVSALAVENVGGMPTPGDSPLLLALTATDWLTPDDGTVCCPPRLPAGDRAVTAGTLTAAIRDYEPTGPGDPLAVTTTIVHRASLPAVRRDFTDYQDASARALGELVVRHPIALSSVRHLRALAPGEATRLRFAVTNVSTVALGARSPGQRALRVRIVATDASELGDLHARITGHGADALALDGWVYELPELAAGATAELTATVTLAADAPEYRALVLAVAVELAPLGQATPRRTQWRELTIRVARAFVADDADVLLVVNHAITAVEVARWEATAQNVAARTSLWDLSREGHLDLDRPLADGRTLGQLLAGKAIVVLNRAFETPLGTVAPHRMLDPDQLLRAAASGLDVLFVGESPGLGQLMVPTQAPDADGAAATPDRATALVAIARGQRITVPIYRRFPLLFWRRPTERWLARQAHAFSRTLNKTRRRERHVVIHRFAPERVSRAWLGGSLWRVGTIETARTLDDDATALVHVDGEADHALAASALLIAFDFAQQLERLRWTLADVGAEPAALATIVDALVVELAGELAAANRPGPGSDDLRAELPKLHALAAGVGSTRVATAGGDALCGLLAQLHYVAETQVSWFDRLPPWRWWRRPVATARLVVAAIEDTVTAAFAADERTAARAAVAARLAEHRAAITTEASGLGRRRRHGLRVALAPVREDRLLADSEVLVDERERVLSGDEYDQIVAARASDAEARVAITEALAAERADLSG